jgi:flagellar basal-body rod modification protein FlgD
MATVNNVIAGVAANTATTTTTNKASSLGEDDFMKMLLVELKNQDPLNPMDGKDFAVQLAQFSSLQQLTNLNTTMSSLPAAIQALNNAQMVNMIGTTATVKGNVINVTGSTTNVVFSLPADIKSGTIKIYDNNGAQVATLPVGSLKAGINSVTWNSGGNSPGNYTFDISAADKNGNPVTPNALMSGTVTGVSFNNGQGYLTINGQQVAFSDIVSVAY